MIRFLAIFLAITPLAYGQQIPINAHKYKRTLRREVTAIWGPEQSAAIFGAQIHAESRWDPMAKSPYAAGLGQQTPGTERWLNELDRDLSTIGGGAYNPHWSIRATVYYDRWLYHHRLVPPKDSFNRWGWALASYNAGLGWIRKEAIKANCLEDYWCCIRYSCLRAPVNCEQTLNYTQRIWFTYKPLYEEEGW